MDYEKLIERLNAYSAEYQCHGGIVAEAADAIKSLLAELGAATSLMHGECYACKSKETKYSDEPCSLCKWGCMRCMVPVAKLNDSWEWRGAK